MVSQAEKDTWADRLRELSAWVAAIPVEPPPDPDPDPPLEPAEWPATATWAEKDAWVRSVAGCKLDDLYTVASQADLAAAGLPGQWVNGQWSLDTPGAYAGLDVRGLIWYSGGGLLMLEDSRANGVHYAKGSGRGPARFARCTLGPSPAGRQLGQGAVNFYGQQGWVIERCELHGFADGVQCVGPGEIIETVFGPLAFGPTTHNDWVQNYGGPVTLRRCVADSTPTRASAQNGIFSSNSTGASYHVEDCVLRVRGPHRATNWVLHANTSTIQVVRSLIDGRTVGTVTYDDASEHVN